MASTINQNNNISQTQNQRGHYSLKKGNCITVQIPKQCNRASLRLLFTFSELVPQFFSPCLLLFTALTSWYSLLCHFYLVFFFYFSPVMRHTDSSLSPSNSPEINFPELFHLEGPLSEFGIFSARDTPVRIHTGFLSPSPTVTKAHRQGT